jgi:hypothetical protein
MAEDGWTVVTRDKVRARARAWQSANVPWPRQRHAPPGSAECLHPRLHHAHGQQGRKRSRESAGGMSTVSGGMPASAAAAAAARAAAQPKQHHNAEQLYAFKARETRRNGARRNKNVPCAHVHGLWAGLLVPQPVLHTYGTSL